MDKNRGDRFASNTLKGGMITTDFEGNRINKREIRPEDLPDLISAPKNINVTSPTRGKLSLRTRFAMGILKVIRRYMT